MLRVVVDRAEASGDNRSVEETDLVAGRWLLIKRGFAEVKN